jgi:hypothetical protein
MRVGLRLAQQLRAARQFGFDGNSFRRVSGYVPGLKRDGNLRGKKEGMTMRSLRILGAVALAVLMTAPDAMAQRRGGGGGAARGGMRGAMVGGMAGGSEGAKKGAAVGVAAGATRAAVNRSADRRAMDSESQSRSEYESSDEYANDQHSDFNESPPEVLITAQSDETATQRGDAIIREDGKPIVGITYPSTWKQKEGKNYVTATSPKGNAWSAIATLDSPKDKEAGITKVKEGLGKYLQNIKYDELTKTERGALLLTGEGKAKKSGIPVVFAIGIFNASPEQLAGAAFVSDKNIEDQYKEAVRYMCQTIRRANDFTVEEHKVAKPVTSN